MIVKNKSAEDILASKQAAQEKSDEREAWFQTVVRITSWREGSNDANGLDESKKITSQEWKNYCEGLLKISVSSGREKTLKKLKEIEQLIKHHNGFKN